MFQEAKSSCAGQWYLPAGRMEPGEDIHEAVKREVLEETGIHFEPSTLLLVESAGMIVFYVCQLSSPALGAFMSVHEHS